MHFAQKKKTTHTHTHIYLKPDFCSDMGSSFSL